MAWQRVLGDYGVEIFHAADCASPENPFYGLSKDDRRRLVTDLVTVICDSELHGVASGIVLEDYHRAINEIEALRDGKDNDPYLLAFKHCVVESCHLADNLPVKEKIAFVFEEQKEFQYRALAMYGRMKENIDWVNHNRLGQIGFDSKKQLIALQMADLAAYEHYKALENKIYDTKRTVRRAVVRLRPKHLQTKYWTFDTLVEALRGSFS